MSLRNFIVNVDDAVYQGAFQRAQGEGKTLEAMLTQFVRDYAASGEHPQSTTYTVRSGDTLTKIARQFYDDPHKYPLIQQANNINQAGTIWVGQVLVIPTPAETAPPMPQPLSPPSSTPQSSTPPPPVPQPPSPETPPSPGTVSANPSFLNGDFEDFQPRLRNGEPRVWKGPRFPEEYGLHWQLKVISEAKKRRARFMSSAVFGRFAQAYFGGGGLNYAYGGGNSQVIASQYGYDLLFMQTVAAQPGRKYKFSGLMVSFYKGTDNPATPNKIFKTLGIDPAGGQDYRSPSIVWGERDSKDHAWINPSVEATAQSSAITLFIRIENTEKNVGVTELNLVHLDKFKLE